MAHLKVSIGRHVVRFPASLNAEAMRFAREQSDRRGMWVEVHLVGAKGAGIVGQYFRGQTTPEFCGHDRAAGPRSPVLRGLG